MYLSSFDPSIPAIVGSTVTSWDFGWSLDVNGFKKKKKIVGSDGLCNGDFKKFSFHDSCLVRGILFVSGRVGYITV